MKVEPVRHYEEHYDFVQVKILEVYLQNTKEYSKIYESGDIVNFNPSGLFRYKGDIIMRIFKYEKQK